MHFGPKMHFWRKKLFLGEKCDFEQKCPLELSRTHIPLTIFASGRGRTQKSGNFAQKRLLGSKMHFWAQKRILGVKVHFLRKNAFLRPHAADAYKTNGISIKMEPFLAQKRFWTEKCILGPETDFWAQSAKNGPEMLFWAQKCIFRKSDQKVNVGLGVPEREQGIPDSSPDSIHGRPGLLKHVAFSVPLHSNNVFRRAGHGNPCPAFVLQGFPSGGARNSVPRLGFVRFFVERGTEIRAPPWFYKDFRRAGHGFPFVL